ncbi:UDP-N-acetylmuramyl pentapeptide phosphotransferase [Microbacterium terricola]|uniref:UDP-N-acetylmuramyl pentapeptide phosphotransferase n=1 Tax=Microbacterium terricola TaxID=344163 RepID=A0ABM8DZF7_9MICO|nr:UDP-N-acetylmuramyl pentapeptide phosphotransferase [Microbacterium terricola]UYK41172.1 UDP-N-acetylmuramyl pentapeptide phosphotransferase [Microbacterium terricola]BDV31057.1 hypothetical protein Microterr_17170 [Microbacterium terricola]
MAVEVGSSAPQTGAHAVIKDATDPARRPDVLFRKRRDEGHQVSPWWLIGAFVAVSAGVIALLSFVPGGA